MEQYTLVTAIEGCSRVAQHVVAAATAEPVATGWWPTGTVSVTWSGTGARWRPG